MDDCRRGNEEEEEEEVRVHQRNQSDGHHVCFSIIDLWLVLYISLHRIIAKSGEKRRLNSLRTEIRQILTRLF